MNKKRWKYPLKVRRRKKRKAKKKEATSSSRTPLYSPLPVPPFPSVAAGIFHVCHKPAAAAVGGQVPGNSPQQSSHPASGAEPCSQQQSQHSAGERKHNKQRGIHRVVSLGEFRISFLTLLAPKFKLLKYYVL